MLGSITHVSDGDVPQSILALGPDGEMPPSKMEELLDGRLQGEAKRKLEEVFAPFHKKEESEADALLAKLA